MTTPTACGMRQYERPRTLKDALELLQHTPYALLAGGTDFYPSFGAAHPKGPVLDITAIDELKGIQKQQTGYTIGALCSWTDLIRADLPPAFKALQLAAVEVGSVQIQNRATVVGNLCNASPAADGVPALLCLDAMINLASIEGTRTVALSEFIQGNRRTLKTPVEMVSSIFIPAASCGGNSDFIKLGARKYLVISIAMVATRLAIENNKINHAALAVGSCSEVATRLPEVESALIGQAATIESINNALPKELTGISPIDDVRSSGAYRRKAALVLLKQSLHKSLEGA